MPALCVRPGSPRVFRAEGVEPATLERLHESSRVIFVLAMPTTENAALLSGGLLELVQPDAVHVLVSRAHVVDFDARTELVLAGRFRAAIERLPVGAPRRAIRYAQLPERGCRLHRAGLVQDALWEIGRRVVDDLEAISTASRLAACRSRTGVRDPLRADDAGGRAPSDSAIEGRARGARLRRGSPASPSSCRGPHMAPSP